MSVPLKLHKQEPIPELVETIEALLQRAKDGEIVAIAFATEARQGNVTNGWTEAMNIHALKSGVMSLFARICLSGMDE